MKEDSHIAHERHFMTERLACFKRNIPKLKETRPPVIAPDDHAGNVSGTTLTGTFLQGTP